MIDLIIPVYNASKTLSLTLMSISLQKEIDKVNIYIIDDCSSDKYDEIFKQFEYLNIKYIKLDKNQGPGIAREIGIENSNSKYIMFIDADDLFYNTDSIKKLYDCIEKGYDYVSGITYDEKKDKNIINESDLHGKIYRREFIKNNNIKFNKSRYHEDNYFNNLYLACNPYKEIINELVYIYVYNKKSFTNKDIEQEFTRLEILLSNMQKFLKETKKRNCNKEIVKNLILYKVRYFNRIYNNKFNENEKNIFKNWLEKYDLNIKEYLDLDINEVDTYFNKNFKLE